LVSDLKKGIDIDPVSQKAFIMYAKFVYFLYLRVLWC